MSTSAALLKLLEPAVRPVAGPPVPGAAPVSAARPGTQPFEAQSFESLLVAARQDPADPTQTPTAAEPQKPPGLLDALAEFGRIENPGLRALLAQAPASIQPAA